MSILSISGLIGSGKDTIVEYLCKNHNYQKVSFSAALKDAVATIFGLDRVMLEGVTEEARMLREQIDPWWSSKLGYEVSPRSILVDFGTRSARDNFNKDIWVLALQKKIELSLVNDYGANLVVSDARFFNELSMVRNLGGTNFRVIRHTPEWVPLFQNRVSSSLGKIAAPVPYHLISDIGMRVMEASDFGIHQSEWEHTLWEHFLYLDNSSTLEDLFKQVDLFVECLI